MNWLVVVAIQPWSYVPTFYCQLSEASHDRVGCRRWQNQSLPPFKTKVKIDRRSKLESVNINHVHHILICFFALFCYQYAFQICFSLFLLIHFIILAVTENGSIGDKWVLKKKKKTEISPLNRLIDKMMTHSHSRKKNCPIGLWTGNFFFIHIISEFA